MKAKRNKNRMWIFISAVIFLTGILNEVSAQSGNTLYNYSSTVNSVTCTYKGQNACVGNNDFSVVKWYRNGVYVTEETVWLGYNEYFDVTHTFNCQDLAPNSTVSISVVADHYYCVTPFPGSYTYTNSTSPLGIPLQSYNPVSSVSATDAKYGDRVYVTWAVNQQFNTHLYRVYKNGVQVSGDLASNTTSYTHSGLPAGSAGTYTVRGVVNGSLQNAPAGDAGSAFDLQLQATTSHPNKIVLSWNGFQNTNAPTGHVINRWDGSNSFEILNSGSSTAVAYEDAAGTLIPGYSYRYIVQALPYSNNITDTAWGKKIPDGSISGSVKTPTGVGVPNVVVKAVLQGSTLPGDTTTVYTAVTNSSGDYTINNIYYYTGSTFTVNPVFAGRTFNPVSTNVTLNMSSHSASFINFTDMSSFTVSGTIMQGLCPMPGVRMLLNGVYSNVMTDASGVYNLTITSGGNYTITPELGNHTFNPSSKTETVTANLTNVNFTDTTSYHVEGTFLASCGTYIGQATIRVYSDDGGVCFADTLTTDAFGYYSGKVPSRNLKFDLMQFVSSDEMALPSVTVMAYFANEQTVNMTHIDTNTFHGDTLVHNYVYRVAPTLTVTGMDVYHTCSGEVIPLLQQHRPVQLDITAWDAFGGNSCYAGDGYVIITENITSDNITPIQDTVSYTQGEVITYTLRPGTPNIIAPYKKFFNAILFRDGQTDTVNIEVIVLGHKPRTQTFTTVTPQMPFHILHNPPGDASYSYLETNQSISNTFSTSFLQTGTIDTYIRAQFGPDISVSTGFGAEISCDLDAQFDITGSFGFGTSGLTEDVCMITSSATERFETSGNVDIVGGAGDVYIGGAMNLLYALSDGLIYDFDNCELRDTLTMIMQPNGVNTTFMYTESHITDVIIPQLQSFIDYLNATSQEDSASYFQNQLDVWQQSVDNNHENIAHGSFITNKTFSGGVLYDNSVTTSSTKSHSLSMNYYIDYGVAVDLGMSVNGVGFFGGVSVAGHSEWGNVAAYDASNYTTVGYVLSDDDLGDSYSVDVVRDSVYGVPAFKIVAGASSCPWEPGTQPREGVQAMSAPTYQEVEETQQAVYVFQLSNTSQSNETMTYDLIFDHTSNPDGAIVTLSGSPVLGNVPYPYTIPAGSSVNATVTVSKGPVEYTYNNLKFKFKSSCDDQIEQDIFISAKFYKEFDLTVAKTGQGTTYPGTGVHTYRDGTQVYLYASPAAGYEFQKWVVGSAVFTDPSIAITIGSDSTATAYFIVSTATQYPLQITCHGNGSTNPPAGTHYINTGNSVNILAVPSPQNVLVKWVINGVASGNNLQTSVVVNTPVTVDAYFAPVNTLQLQIAQGAGSTTPPTGYNTVFRDSIASLYATPDSGFVFEKWKLGTVEYTSQALDIIVTQDTLVQVFFAPATVPQYQVVVTNIGSGYTVPPAGTHYFDADSSATLTAFPNTGYVFDKWIVNGTTYTTNPLSITVSGNQTVEAYFILDPTTGVTASQSASYDVIVYPNPTSGVVHIRSTEKIGKLEVYDVYGKLILSEDNISGNEYTFDLRTQAAGSYIVRLTGQGSSSVFKIQRTN